MIEDLFFCGENTFIDSYKRNNQIISPIIRALCIWGIVFGSIMFISGFLFPSVSATINVSAINITQNSINWQWNNGLTLTKLSVDGVLIPLVDNTSFNYILNDAYPNTKHIIIVYTSSDMGTNISYTSGDNSAQNNIWQWVLKWLEILIVPLIIVVIAVWLRLNFVAYISLLFSGYNIITNLNSTNWYYALISGIVFILCCIVAFEIDG